MKKLFYSASALVALLLAASCQQENLEPEVSASSVTYSVEVPQVETKAIGDGQNVNQLIYEVWRTASKNDKTLTEAPGTERLFVGEAVVENGKATFQVDLVNDQNYTLLFWAQVKDKGFYNTSDLKNVTFNGGKKWVANDDARAAFYGIDHIDGENPKAEETVELTRPFAQLNLGSVVRTQAQDKVYELTADQAFVKVTGAATSFNVATAAAGSETMTTTFAKADDPVEPLTVNGTGYDWVAMNYFFVPANQATVKVDYTIYTNHGEVTNTVENVPVQMNYRTNIIGNLLTSTTDYTVELDTDWGGNDYFGPEFVKEPQKNDEGEYVVTNESELAWLAAMVNGTLPGTKAAPVTTSTFKGETFVLDRDIDLKGMEWTPIGSVKGANKEQYSLNFKGVFDGNGHIIRNLKVDNADVAGLFGYMTEGTVKNLTIDGFELDANHYAGSIVGWNEGSKTLIDNCKVLNGEINLTVKDDDLGDKAGAVVGFAHGGTYTNNVVSAVTIEGYRDLGGVAGNLQSDGKVEKNNVSNITIIADLTVSYDGDKDCNAGAVVGRINSDKVTVADNIIGENITITRKVDTTKELEYAVAEAQDGDTIYIGSEVTMPYFTDKALNFVGLNADAAVMQSPATHIDEFYAGAELHFTNLTLVGEEYKSNTQGYQKAVKETYTECTFQNYIMFAGDVTLVNNCNFVSNVGQYFWTATAGDITFNECKFNVLERAVKVCTVGNSGERVVTFNECQFTAQNPVKAAIEIDGTKGSSYVVNINECTETGFAAGEFTGETLFNVEGEDNVTVYLDGSRWMGDGIFKAEDGTEYYTNTAALTNALANAQAGDVINLLPGEFAITSTSYKPNIKLIGTSAEEVKVNVENQKPGLGGGDVYVENVTLKFSNGDYFGFQHTGDEVYKKCIIEGQPFLYGESVTFEECTFIQTSSAAYNVWTYGATDVKFNKCTFNSAGKSVLIYKEAAHSPIVKFTECSFNASTPVTGKAAVEIDASFPNGGTGKYKIIFDDKTTATGFALGSRSNNNLWNIKNEQSDANCEIYVGDMRILADGLAMNREGEYIVSNANGFAYFSEKKDLGDETVISIQNDIDFKNSDFKALIAGRNKSLIVKGNDHIISNAHIISGAEDNTTGQAGLFYTYPNSTLTISDLTVNKCSVEADINGTGYAGVLVGYVEGNLILNNVDVKSSMVYGEKSCGLLAGFVTATGSLKAEECDVIDCSGSVVEDRIGAWVGRVAGKAEFINCTAAQNEPFIAPDGYANKYIGQRYSTCTSCTVNGAEYLDSYSSNIVIESLTDNQILCIGGDVEYLTGGSHGEIDFKNATIKGLDGDEKFIVVGDGVPDFLNVNLESLTFVDQGTYLPTANEFMYQNFSGTTSFKKVKFLDGIRIGTSYSTKTAAKVNFENCEFIADTHNEYALWIDTAEVGINQCSFDATSTAYGIIKCEKADAVVNVTDCKYHDETTNGKGFIYNKYNCNLTETGTTTF